MNAELFLLRRVWLHDKALDCLKVATAFAGVLAFCFGLGHEDWLIGLLLGTIACALAETPDRVGGRLRALLATLASFAFASFSVRLLFPYPWLFVLGLGVSTLGFVMLGALGERYAAIAVASIVLAIYTMLSLSQHGLTASSYWHEPQVLLAGAAWYGCISILSAMLFAIRPARQIVAQVFDSLAGYLTLKAKLLEPLPDADVNAQRLALAEQNGRLVGIMNKARETLLPWTRDARMHKESQMLLRWYFLAQEIHERTSSSHYPYQALACAFARSDILFRCQHLLLAQARNCQRQAGAILNHRNLAEDSHGSSSRLEMEAALAYLHEHCATDDAPLLESVADLCRNIGTIEQLFVQTAKPGLNEPRPDNSLRDHDPQTLREVWQRLKAQCSPSAKLFRHGTRLALALAAGYGLIHLFALPQGYWVMLTTAFVCQPNFSTTWQRLGQRVAGTLAGLCAAVLFITYIPHPLAQLALLLASGMAFFALRADRYLGATACITVLVMICFNQFGSSYALIFPRLFDTLLGCALAAMAVTFVLPDWQGRQLHHAMAHAIDRSNAYLGEILTQYRQGKQDHLAYRIVRREAHLADGELSTTLFAMLKEPGRYSVAPDLAFRFLHASHTLLGYISALGAHREHITQWHHDNDIEDTEQLIRARLQQLAQALDTRSTVSAIAPESVQVHDIHDNSSEPERRILRQLRLIEQLLPEIADLACAFAHQEKTPAATPGTPEATQF